MKNLVKWWSQGTRNERGNFCRHGDWSIEQPADWEPPHHNFTTISPPDECLREDDPVPCDWEDGQWVVDSDARDAIKERRELEAEERTDIMSLLKIVGVLLSEERAATDTERNMLVELTARMGRRIDIDEQKEVLNHAR